MLEQSLKAIEKKVYVVDQILTNYTSIDLSVSNIELKQINVSNSKELHDYIAQMLNNEGGHVGFGGYLERRSIYQRSSNFNQEESSDARDIHLGVDLWCEAGTKVYAAISGKVHSFQNNVGLGDYGPTIILEHDLDGQVFYTLYGHLSLESIQDKKVGQQVNKGEQIATLGSSEVNGDYPPHLHFQIIKDLEGNVGDYPGVCNGKELPFYKVNCPDPKLLLHT